MVPLLFIPILIDVDSIIETNTSLDVSLYSTGLLPVPIIIDPDAITPLSSNVLRNTATCTPIIVTTKVNNNINNPIEVEKKHRIKALNQCGAYILFVNQLNDQDGGICSIDLTDLFLKLTKNNTIGKSILIEGGSNFISKFLSKSVDTTLNKDGRVQNSKYSLIQHLFVNISPKYLFDNSPSLNLKKPNNMKLGDMSVAIKDLRTHYLQGNLILQGKLFDIEDWFTVPNNN